MACSHHTPTTQSIFMPQEAEILSSVWVTEFVR